MTDNERATIGGNNPPEDQKWPAYIADVLAPWQDILAEADQWLDGDQVETEGQMKAVDAMLKEVKAAEKALGEARDAATKPLHEAWKTEISFWKPAVEDLERVRKALAAMNTAFKNKLAAEKEEARRLAAAKAAEDRRIAEEAEAKAAANASDINAQREAARAQEQFQASRREASEARQDKVTGLRTVWHYAVDDNRMLLNWIAKNDPTALREFLNDYAAKNHRAKPLPGVRSWTTKEGW